MKRGIPADAFFVYNVLGCESGHVIFGAGRRVAITVAITVATVDLHPPVTASVIFVYDSTGAGVW